MRHTLDLVLELPIGPIHVLLLRAAATLPIALLIVLLAAAAVLFPGAGAMASSPANPNTIRGAIAALKDGNARFLSDRVEGPNRTRPVLARLARDGQTPLAAVLACSDSRVSLEQIFDLGFGDLFTVEVAGAVPGVDQVGSLEYAVAHLGVPVVLVLSHTQCGAVEAALSGEPETGALGQLIRKISPVATAVEGLDEARRLQTAVELSAAVFREQLPLVSPVIDQAVRSGRLAVISGVLDTATGAVKFDLGRFGPAPTAAPSAPAAASPEAAPGAASDAAPEAPADGAPTAGPAEANASDAPSAGEASPDDASTEAPPAAPSADDSPADGSASGDAPPAAPASGDAAAPAASPSAGTSTTPDFQFSWSSQVDDDAPADQAAPDSAGAPSGSPSGSSDGASPAPADSPDEPAASSDDAGQPADSPARPG